MNSSASWDIRIDQSVFKEIKRIPAEAGKRVLAVIEDETFDPYVGDIRKVKGEENRWARRVGEYRIYYEVYQSTRIVNIVCVERRTTQSYKHGR